MMEQANLSQKLLNKIDANQHTVIEFFAVFSRFEYSLKRANYVDESNGGVVADWDKFAREHNLHFDKNQSPDLKAAVDYLIHNPPKKQILSNDELSWRNTPWDRTKPLLVSLLLAIKRIRNNLFHGGKFREQPIQDPARNQVLLKAGLCILETCLNLEVETAKEVRHYFEEGLD